MQQEMRMDILAVGAEDVTLRPGAEASFMFDGTALQGKSCRLFFTGETVLQYLWKNEPDYPVRYRQLDDVLDTSLADKAPYCLKLVQAAPRDYVQRAYKKVLWPPVLSYLPLVEYGEDWQGGIHVRAESLAFAPGGYARLRIEVRHARPDVSRHSTIGPPDQVIDLPIPEGTYGWQTLQTPLSIPVKETANVCVLLEAEGYTGMLLVERPFLLSSNGYNVLPDFGPDTQDREWYGWTGQNLSRKEWPEFRLAVNGKTFFEGERFERCHRYSEVEVDIPAGLIQPGHNVLTIALTSSYREAMPYAVHEVALLARPGDVFTIVSSPHSAAAGGVAAVWLETTVEKLELTLECPSGVLRPMEGLRLEGMGLHVLRLQCTEAATDVRFTLRAEGCEAEGVIPRIVRKAEDGVLTGTGDMIYVNHNMPDMAAYLRWYVQSEVGNLLTIRPVYRWCGTRTVQPAVWEMVTGLLEKAGIAYAHMMDGRELPGLAANPAYETLDGPMFLGRQEHERDGAQFYWRSRAFTHSPTMEQFHDMQMRIFDEAPDTANLGASSANYFLQGDTLTPYRDPELAPDVAVLADFSVHQLAKTCYNATRHTGPSVMFKYFYQAGYEWLGAETMYGSMEPLLAFLRGASYCYGQKDFGVHHAVQWSSSPHDTPERFRRFRLALYVSYLQGVSQINTEEGLWHMEEYYSHFNRFGDACRGHAQQQCDFFRYVASHSRTGYFYTPFAFLHGNLDGWHGFGHARVWGREDFAECDAERSWDLLKVFYPLSKPGDTLYIHGCPSEAVGYHTGTPRGNADVIPAEADGDFLSRYKVLAFLGYHCATRASFDALEAYVREGGTLLLGWPHANTVTERQAIAAYAHVYLRHTLLPALQGSEVEFAADALEGQPLHVVSNLLERGEVLAQTDAGQPLAVRYRRGSGQVVFVNAREYPGHAAVRPVYERLIAMLSDELNGQEEAFVRCGDDVQFALYDQPDGSRHIYLLAVDWFRDPEGMRKARLIVSGQEIPVEVPFGCMLKIVVKDGVAAWATDEVAEVLSVQLERVSVQGAGVHTFCIAQGGQVYEKKVDFAHQAVQDVILE